MRIEVIDTLFELIVMSYLVEQASKVIGKQEVLRDVDSIGRDKFAVFSHLEEDTAVNGEGVVLHFENFFEAPLGDWGKGIVIAPQLIHSKSPHRFFPKKALILSPTSLLLAFTFSRASTLMRNLFMKNSNSLMFSSRWVNGSARTLW